MSHKSSRLGFTSLLPKCWEHNYTCKLNAKKYFDVEKQSFVHDKMDKILPVTLDDVYSMKSYGENLDVCANDYYYPSSSYTNWRTRLY